MFFQAITVENKQLFYANGIIHQKFDPKFTKTWSYATYLKEHHLEYAQFRCSGKTIDEVCPAHLETRWEEAKKKVKSHCRACIEAKLDITNGKFYNLLPEKVLLEYLEAKNQITKYVFENYQKPKNYVFLNQLQQVISEIENNRVRIDLSPLKSQRHQFRVNQFYNKVSSISPNIRYNIFGTKTGRLTTKKGSFPILTMDKNYREILHPQNDIFVELDYNAAELRTLLSLAGKEQPTEDIHDWNINNIFNSNLTREEAKKRVFAWLYNPAAVDEELESVYNRDYVLQKYWDGGKITNPYGREIEADEKHALNYIIQSTTSDIFLNRILELAKILEGSKSFISFLIHDSVVIDLAKEERHLVKELANVFSDTEYSKFLVNIKAGKNYGEMKDICKM